MPTPPIAIQDGEQVRSRSNDEDWIVSWHPGPVPPAGTPHGAAGVCVIPDDQLVLISPDGEHWGLPGGRPEGAETFEETLRREMLEEACAVVLQTRLLGSARGECVDGWQHGLVLVRSFWRAEVDLQPWDPTFEISHRRLVPTAEARLHLSDPDPAAIRITLRALKEAGIG